MTDPGPSDGTTTAPGEGESTSVGTEDGPAGLQAALREMEDRWRRALADLDNLRKRVQRDRLRMQEEERARAAREWLPVLDNLDLALAHAKPVPDPVIDGVRAVRDQALDVLARLGFPRREDRGSSFDPQRHEAVRCVSFFTAIAAPPSVRRTLTALPQYFYWAEPAIMHHHGERPGRGPG